MRWEGGEQSGNVEDRRSAGGAGGMLGGRGLSMGTLVIAVIAAMIFGVNPLQLLGMLSGGPMQVQQSPQTESASPQSAANDRDLQFTRTVLRDADFRPELLLIQTELATNFTRFVLVSGF